MTISHILGYPRLGAARELKFALERFWRGESDALALQETGWAIRAANWQAQRDAGLDFVTVGDFSFYDPMLDHLVRCGCVPPRFGFDAPLGLTEYFQLARGTAQQRALEMTKWFDTNYHYLVPELTQHSTFQLSTQTLFEEVDVAMAAGHRVKPVLIGPLTFLWLAKSKDGSERLELLERLLPVYGEILTRLRAQGVEWAQIDEPILALQLPLAWQRAFERAYHALHATGVKILLATYFGPLHDNLRPALQLPVAGIHLDVTRGATEWQRALTWLPSGKILSAGIIDGRNVWRSDLDAARDLLASAHQRLGDRLWVAPSCSLLHVPVSLALEPVTPALDAQVRNWLAFAAEKLQELAVLKAALRGDASAEESLTQQRAILAERHASPRVCNASVSAQLATLTADNITRRAPFAQRRAAQRARLKLPAFPTTTIGSFPQTSAIRAARARFKKGELSAADYEQAMRAEIAHAVAQQEEIGLDVLVHGEAERNDMVEYFGEQLDGFAFTTHGWVQSYGSRCVKPPILYGTVQRRAPMTVAWSVYAQSLTDKPVKGMLTGPVTILQWSFVRDDQPRAQTALQIAAAIREEVADLQNAGIAIIQIDEPALREGLPLHRVAWDDYLAWAGHAFRVAAGSAADATQIHTHMCYAEFNDILPAIAALDADVITLETSRSDVELLCGCDTFHYPNEIGPGVYDIHSPRVPSVAEMVSLLRKAQAVIASDQLWVNPDCGLKTRAWPETTAALRNMVAAARVLREERVGAKNLGETSSFAQAKGAEYTPQ